MCKFNREEMFNKKECISRILFKFYFSISLLSFIVTIIFVFMNPLEYQGIKDYIHNWKLSPIYDIYISDSKTDDTIQLGELEEYSDDTLKIKSAEIYKWRNKYFNVKRLETQIKDLNGEYSYKALEPKPINNIIITEGKTISGLDMSNYVTISIDKKYYLHYSRINETDYDSVIVDLKISHRNPFTYSDEEKNICFLQYCSIFENKNMNGNIIDKDSSDNFIKYNNIVIEGTNSFGFYKPKYFQLYGIKNVKEYYTKINYIITLKALCITFFVINFTSRLFKLLSFFDISNLSSKSFNNCCKCLYNFTCLNIILIIIHIINLAFLITILCLFELSFDNSYTKFFTYHKSVENIRIILIILIVTEILSIFFTLPSDFAFYYEEWDYLNDEWDSSHVFCPCLLFCLRKKLYKIESEENQKDNDLEINREELLNLEGKIKTIPYNIELKEIRYNNLLNKLNEDEKEEIEKLHQKINEMDEDFNNLQASIQTQKDLKMYNIQSLKLEINCIYFDPTIDGEKDSSGFQFFKFLKNSIKGIFFAIKSENDLDNLLSEIGKKLKFVLIIKDSDYYNYLNQGFSEYFSSIIIFSIKDQYDSIIEKLKEIEKSDNQIFDNDLMKKYKPYKLILYSDYRIYNYKKCHQELLKNTILNLDIENINEEEFKKGLTFIEYQEFISFLNSLEEVNDNEIIDTPLNDENIYDKNRKLTYIEMQDKNIENNNNEINTKIESLKQSFNNKNIIDPLLQNIDNINLEENNGNKINVNVIEGDHNLFINFDDINNDNDDIIFVDNDLNISNNYLGKIEKSRKKNIIKFFRNPENDYSTSDDLIKLYTSEPEKFYRYINIWLMTLNYKLYKKISPIIGKIMNRLYKQISENRIFLNNEKSMNLYRGFSLKKTDIYLYKACEGNIICYAQFLSTTTNINRAKEFLYEDNENDLRKLCSCLIKLEYNIKNGCKEQAADIKHISVFAKEEEILFPPFSFFKIEKVIFDKYNFKGTKQNPFVIELKVINRDFYLDQAILKKQRFDYDINKNIWILRNGN